jgi:toxin ParE1/3/4
LNTYTVVFTPEAQAQRLDLYRFIAKTSSPEVAARYTGPIVTSCESLHIAPHRCTKRDEDYASPTNASGP